jgi:hypothetical protein
MSRAIKAGGAAGQGLKAGWVVAAVVVAVMAAVLAGWRAGVFPSGASPEVGGGLAAAPATATVVREDLSATTPVAATLGYAGSYPVLGKGSGTLTWLPPTGSVIRQGQVLYRIDNGSPVVLLYGSVPAWRSLGEGVFGADVSQLNRDLVALGYVGRADIAAGGWDYYSGETAYAVQRLEARLGVSAAPGSLSLGQAVFEPAAIRVARLAGSLGGSAIGPVLQATSTEHVVTIALATSQESEVKVGDAVSVTLPDGTSTPGVVGAVGTVATTAASGSGGTVTTVPIQVTITHPAAAGRLDQAPVTVYITTANARDALAVPVTALQARSPHEYVVEVVGRGGHRRYVPVTVGAVFDDNTGMVQVSGSLVPGQRVVVASS